MLYSVVLRRLALAIACQMWQPRDQVARTQTDERHRRHPLVKGIRIVAVRQGEVRKSSANGMSFPLLGVQFRRLELGNLPHVRGLRSLRGSAIS